MCKNWIISITSQYLEPFYCVQTIAIPKDQLYLGVVAAARVLPMSQIELLDL